MRVWIFMVTAILAAGLLAGCAASVEGDRDAMQDEGAGAGGAAGEGGLGGAAPGRVADTGGREGASPPASLLKSAITSSSGRRRVIWASSIRPISS